jgi:hypothetical protein
VGSRERPGLTVAWQEAANATVGVLDGALRMSERPDRGTKVG